MSLTDDIADGIIKKVHDVVPDNIEALIPDDVEKNFEGAIRHAVETTGAEVESKLEEALPESVQKVAEGFLPQQ